MAEWKQAVSIRLIAYRLHVTLSNMPAHRARSYSSAAMLMPVKYIRDVTLGAMACLKGSSDTAFKGRRRSAHSSNKEYDSPGDLR